MSPCYLRSMLQGHLCNRWSWLWSPTMLAFQPHCTAPWLHSSGSCRARGWAQLQLCFPPPLLQQSFTDFFEGTKGWTCIHTRVGKNVNLLSTTREDIATTIANLKWGPHQRVSRHSWPPNAKSNIILFNDHFLSKPPSYTKEVRPLKRQPTTNTAGSSQTRQPCPYAHPPYPRKYVYLQLQARKQTPIIPPLPGTGGAKTRLLVTSVDIAQPQTKTKLCKMRDNPICSCLTTYLAHIRLLDHSQSVGRSFITHTSSIHRSQHHITSHHIPKLWQHRWNEGFMLKKQSEISAN